MEYVPACLEKYFVLLCGAMAERPQFGIELLTEQQRLATNGVYTGLRDREDPITWRTMAIQMRSILGSSNPERVPATASLQEATTFVEEMTRGTYMENLTPEILYALGYKEIEDGGHLDTLIISPRHAPDELFWKLADQLSEEGQQIGVFIPVGHYADHEPRILSPRKLFHDVDNVVLIGSTQYMYGGSVSVFVETLNLLRNEEFAPRVKNVSVVIPMFAGSRGHKLGQAPEIGYEVLQSKSIPARFSLDVKDVLDELGENAPNVQFFSVDIHNEEYPNDEFVRRGFEFTSIGPEDSFAHAVVREIKEQKLQELPLRLIAVDRGAVKRTEKLAIEILKLQSNGYNFIDVVEVKKVRNTAGQVESASVEKIVRMSAESDVVTKTVIEMSSEELAAAFIRVTDDDMLDSGRSAKTDDVLIDQLMPNPKLKMTVVSHPVMSEGVRSALDNTGSDVIIVGNTLTNPELYKDSRGRVRVVDLSSDISKAINQKK